MNRRNFLRALVPTIVAPAAVVELLIPKRTIFLPPRGGWFNAGVPEFLTAYVEPKILEVIFAPTVASGRMLDRYGELCIPNFVRKPFETDFDLRARITAAMRENARARNPWY